MFRTILLADGITYKYIIGKTYIKIKNVGLFKISEVGNLIRGTKDFSVGPSTVRAIIEGNNSKLPRVYQCKKHKISTVSVAYNPYLLEIFGKKQIMADCEKCLEELYDDI